MKQQICHGRKPYVVKVSFMQCFDAEFPLLKLKTYYFCLKLIIYVTRQFSFFFFSQEYSHEANQEILRKRFKFKGLGKFIKMV